MKINNFYDKSPVDKNNKLKITASGVQNVVDTSTITRLEAELENLKQKLEIVETNFSIATTQHIKEKEQFSIAIRKSKEAKTEVSKIQERNELLKLNNKVLTDSLKGRDTTIDKLKSEVHRLTPLANNYAEAQNNYTSTKTDLERFSETSRLLAEEKKALVTQVNDLEGYTQSIKTDFETMTDEYNTMSNTLSKVNGDNVKLRKGLNEAQRNIQTWKNGFATLEEENANLTGIKNNLTTWLEQIQGEASNLTGKSSLQDKELQKAKQTIVEMGQTVDDLLDTNSYLRERNNKYLTELNKPRYASIGAISRQEGFRFPTQFIAPKNSLGSGKPTLLKVRKT
jgi:chromosome segregation ATPase